MAHDVLVNSYQNAAELTIGLGDVRRCNTTMDSGFKARRRFVEQQGLLSYPGADEYLVLHPTRGRSSRVGHGLIMRLLLIEDDENMRSAMETFFVDRGYGIQCAGEVEEAIAVIRHHRFDVVILDLELNSIEGLDGFGVLKALRQSCPRTRVIIHSGHSGQMIKDAVLRHGGTRFMVKPQSLNQLLASVEELCPLPC